MCVCARADEQLSIYLHSIQQKLKTESQWYIITIITWMRIYMVKGKQSVGLKICSVRSPVSLGQQSANRNAANSHRSRFVLFFSLRVFFSISFWLARRSASHLPSATAFYDSFIALRPLKQLFLPAFVFNGSAVIASERLNESKNTRKKRHSFIKCKWNLKCKTHKKTQQKPLKSSLIS